MPPDDEHGSACEGTAPAVTTGAQPPVAMFRGGPSYWQLYAGSPGDRIQIPGPEMLTTFHGDADTARAKAREWCGENGYYLSPWSDGDDRVPQSACICDPASPLSARGCPRHWPTTSTEGVQSTPTDPLGEAP